MLIINYIYDNKKHLKIRNVAGYVEEIFIRVKSNLSNEPNIINICKGCDIKLTFA